MPRTPKKWTEDEDRILKKAVAEQNHGPHEDWHRIAACLPGRNNKDCRKRWHYRGNGVVRKGPWKLDEDHRLWKGVQKHGSRWALVAQEVETRNGDQCAKRWKDALDPNLDHSDWQEEEDEKLREAVETYGRNWKTIVENYFPRRSRLSAKNRYALLERKREIQDQISAFSPQNEAKDSPPQGLPSWGTSGTGSISGASSSGSESSTEPADVRSSASPASSSHVHDMSVDDCMMPDAAQEGTPEFFPWTLSASDNTRVITPRREVSPFAKAPPTPMENWAADIFDDIGFLGDIRDPLNTEAKGLTNQTCDAEATSSTTELFSATAALNTAVGQTVNPEALSDNSAVSTVDCHAPADQSLDPVTLSALNPGATQNYTISVQGATFETIQSILEILLKTRTPVSIQSTS